MPILPILIVDDNEFIRASMIKFLETNKYDVIGVGNAQSAMDHLRETKFSLVITDVLMPETDGFELVDFIRGYGEPLKSVPVIAISGGGKTIDADAALSALEEKVDLILKKPFSKRDLLDQVATLVSENSLDGEKSETLYVE